LLIPRCRISKIAVPSTACRSDNPATAEAARFVRPLTLVGVLPEMQNQGGALVLQPQSIIGANAFRTRARASCSCGESGDVAEIAALGRNSCP
jgi:hypothetical protein